MSLTYKFAIDIQKMQEEQKEQRELWIRSGEKVRSLGQRID